MTYKKGTKVTVRLQRERERERERAVPGTIEDVVKDMFDGSPLYLVRTAHKVLAVKEDSFINKP